jgi:hypothetical protein
VIYFAPWQGILRYVPFANVLETTIPNGFQAFLENPWWLFSCVIFFAPLGPVTIYAITWFRFEKGEDRGRTTLSLLELLCYLSGILLFLSIVLYFDLTRFALFADIYLLIILPGTFGCNGLILWGEASLSSLINGHRIWSFRLESEQR